MHIAMTAILLFAAALGHVAIAVWLFNRLHALGWPRPLVKSLEKFLLLVAWIVLIFIAASFLIRISIGFGQSVLSGYIGFCCLASALIVPLWLIPKLLE